MTPGHKLQAAIALLQTSDDPVNQMRDLVVRTGGLWLDDTPAVLFEVQYCGVVGNGIDARAAVQNWLAHAETLQIHVETAA
jgi:hypothetical protein